MKAHTEKFRLTHGDVLGVTWTEDVWVAPSSGAQYAYASDALRQEIVECLRASGDEIDVDDITAVSDYGEWIEASS